VARRGERACVFLFCRALPSRPPWPLLPIPSIQTWMGMTFLGVDRRAEYGQGAQRRGARAFGASCRETSPLSATEETSPPSLSPPFFPGPLLRSPPLCPAAGDRQAVGRRVRLPAAGSAVGAGEEGMRKRYDKHPSIPSQPLPVSTSRNFPFLTHRWAPPAAGRPPSWTVWPGASRLARSLCVGNKKEKKEGTHALPSLPRSSSPPLISISFLSNFPPSSLHPGHRPLLRPRRLPHLPAPLHGLRRTG